jgi:hypothetical protein
MSSLPSWSKTKKEKTNISGDNTGLLERLTLDSTDVGIGAVLLQDGKDDKQ